jgi:hypothetical protein
VLKRLVSGAPSAEVRSSELRQSCADSASQQLPEFLGLLQMHETRSPRAGHASLPTSPQRGLSPLPSSPGPLAASKLRYAAYPAPGSPPTLKHRALSPAGSMSPQRARRVLQMEDTLTPGDLALSALELDTLGTPASHAVSARLWPLQVRLIPIPEAGGPDFARLSILGRSYACALAGVCCAGARFCGDVGGACELHSAGMVCAPARCGAAASAESAP